MYYLYKYEYVCAETRLINTFFLNIDNLKLNFVQIFIILLFNLILN
jgi:hypothetical protein